MCGVDLVMVTYNTPDLVLESVPSVLGTEYCDFTLTVVDNSTDETTYRNLLELQGEYPDLNLIKTYDNVGYGRACNAGATIGQHPYIIFLNSDIELHPYCKDWITPLINCLNEEKVAVAGPKMVNRENHIMAGPVRGNNKIQSYEYFGDLDYGQYNIPEDVVTVSGACFAIHRQLFEEWDGFDPYYFLYYEETDLAYRARDEGHRVRYCPNSVLVHLHRQSEKDEQVWIDNEKRSRLYFHQKWMHMMEDLKFYGRTV
jgi:GT2 family glycosyltransferase